MISRKPTEQELQKAWENGWDGIDEVIVINNDKGFIERLNDLQDDLINMGFLDEKQI